MFLRLANPIPASPMPKSIRVPVSGMGTEPEIAPDHVPTLLPPTAADIVPTEAFHIESPTFDTGFPTVQSSVHRLAELTSPEESMTKLSDGRTNALVAEDVENVSVPLAQVNSQLVKNSTRLMPAAASLASSITKQKIVHPGPLSDVSSSWVQKKF